MVKMAEKSETGPYILTEEEAEGVKLIRQRMGDLIPEDLNTDFNLRRWFLGWRGIIDEIEPRFRTFIENRHAARFDRDGFEERYFQWINSHPFMEYISMTDIFSDMPVNPTDNSIVFLEKLGNLDLNLLVSKIISMGDCVMTNFYNAEFLMRIVLAHEKASGRPSGLTIVFDMEGSPISRYLSLNSPWNRANKLNVHIFQDWYCDIMMKMVTVKPPRLFYVMWEVIKHLLNENTQKKLAVVMTNEGLAEMVDPGCLPPVYGGSMRPNSDNVDAETCMKLAKEPSESDFWQSGKVWRDLKISAPPEYTVEHMRPRAKFTVVKEIPKVGTRLGWQFRVNGEITFAILHENEGEKPELVHPRLYTTKGKLPDEGIHECEMEGRYVFEFCNTSSYLLSIKLQYAILAADSVNGAA